jgi:hypothetical protein
LTRPFRSPRILSDAQRTTGFSESCWLGTQANGCFPRAGARFVEPLGRGTTTTIASLLTDRLAIGETEPFQSGIISV